MRILVIQGANNHSPMMPRYASLSVRCTPLVCGYLSRQAIHTAYIYIYIYLLIHLIIFQKLAEKNKSMSDVLSPKQL